jgi:hypothetical protein
MKLHQSIKQTQHIYARAQSILARVQALSLLTPLQHTYKIDVVFERVPDHPLVKGHRMPSCNAQDNSIKLTLREATAGSAASAGGVLH